LRDSNGLRRFEVQRYPSVKVTGHKLTIDDSGLKIIPVDKNSDGIEAVVHQHEIDHHRGVLISDIGKVVELL
jgi:peptide deformylase